MSLIKQEDLYKLNIRVKERGHVDREHITDFLALIPTNDSDQIVKEVQDWLTYLHENPEYKSVTFPPGDIDAVLGDLDSYGRVQPITIQKFKDTSNKVLGAT
jgi:hypothetical protein